jgi:hypothetical protein
VQIYRLLIILLVATSVVTGGGKKVLIEVFTNSHCVVCPSAHSTIDNYLQNGQNKNSVVYLYYHMPFPYPDDKLNQENTADPSARNVFYGSFTSTPRAVFDGQVQANNFSSWGSSINTLATQTNIVDIEISGTVQSGLANVTAKLKSGSSSPSGNLIVQFIAVENVNYAGRNGISFHKNVMRKMFPGANGKAITLTANQDLQITESVALNQQWNTAQLGFIVFVQNAQSKAILNAEYVSYSTMISTSIGASNTIPTETSLNQNYPNPFNPETLISYRLANSGYVKLKVYDLLGREVAILINEVKSAGSHEVKFNSTVNNQSLPSGIYYYQLQTENFIETRKMLLVK